MYTLFHKQHFYKQRHAEICKKNQAKSKATPWGWTFAIWIDYSLSSSRYRLKIIGNIFKNVQKTITSIKRGYMTKDNENEAENEKSIT